MRNLRQEFRDVADRDPATALIVLLVLAGVLVFGLIVGGVLFGSYAFLWWVWPIKAGVWLGALAVDYGIWTIVARTYRV